MNKTIPLKFESEIERQKWFIQNADYFTVIRLIAKDRRYERHEKPNLIEAEAEAKRILASGPGRPLLIYAVVGASEHFVKAVGTK